MQSGIRNQMKIFDAIQKLQEWRAGGAGMQNDTESQLGGQACNRGIGMIWTSEKSIQKIRAGWAGGAGMQNDRKINSTSGRGRAGNSP